MALALRHPAGEAGLAPAAHAQRAARSAAGQDGGGRKGLALHIGLNSVDPAHYAGWEGKLRACENDAWAMHEIAAAQGFAPCVMLLTKQATRAAVLEALQQLATQLQPGDALLLTYSGHGGQVDDTQGDEDDAKDETWCLYDGQLIDDEIYLALAAFAPGVRIAVLSDSCHSGTVVRAMPPPPDRGHCAKLLPADVAQRVYEANKEFYDRIQADVKTRMEQLKVDAGAVLDGIGTAASSRQAIIAASFQPACLLLSGCQDNQFSMDGVTNGRFTEGVLKTWQGGAWRGSWRLFHSTLVAGMPASQTPNFFTMGTGVAAFVQERPFTI